MSGEGPLAIRQSVSATLRTYRVNQSGGDVEAVQRARDGVEAKFKLRPTDSDAFNDAKLDRNVDVQVLCHSRANKISRFKSISRGKLFKSRILLHSEGDTVFYKLSP